MAVSPLPARVCVRARACVRPAAFAHRQPMRAAQVRNAVGQMELDHTSAMSRLRAAAAEDKATAVEAVRRQLKEEHSAALAAAAREAALETEHAVATRLAAHKEAVRRWNPAQPPMCVA